MELFGLPFVRDRIIRRQMVLYCRYALVHVQGLYSGDGLLCDAPLREQTGNGD